MIQNNYHHMYSHSILGIPMVFPGNSFHNNRHESLYLVSIIHRYHHYLFVHDHDDLDMRLLRLFQNQLLND